MVDRPKVIQIIVMTGNRNSYSLYGFFHQWRKYYDGECVGVLVGFERPDVELPDNFRFVSQGSQENFPPNQWSSRLINVLEEIADDVFMLLLDDYWLIRQVDTRAIKMIYGYMEQFTYTLKIDLTYDRLYSSTPPGGQNRFYWGFNDYGSLGYLDLIQSDINDSYHMSLQAAMWRRDHFRSVLVPGERAQEIEMYGGERLKQRPELLVLGTRQAPIRHINAIQNRQWNEQRNQSGLSMLNKNDWSALKEYYGWTTTIDST